MTQNQSTGSNYNFDPEDLDSLYNHQLQDLREFTLKLDDAQDINLCRQWLQIFNNISEPEKIARNCLCTLMCHQVKNKGHLSRPFTDISNCNHHLAQVLANINQSFSNDSYSFQFSREFTSDKSLENFHEQNHEVIQLKRQLQALEQQRDEKNEQISELTGIIEKCNQCKMEHDVVRKISILLEGLRTKNSIENVWIFSTLFEEENNGELNQTLINFDKAFQAILQEKIKTQSLIIRNQLTKGIKKREKLLKRFTQELHMQKWQQKMRLKLVKLQFCSIMSRIFVKNRENVQIQMLDLFNQLEAKYRNIFFKLTS